MDTRSTRERRLLNPGDIPTQPRLRLPRFALPAALPAVPWIERRAEGDGGGIVPAGRPIEGGAERRGGEVW